MHGNKHDTLSMGLMGFGTEGLMQSVEEAFKLSLENHGTAPSGPCPILCKFIFDVVAMSISKMVASKICVEETSPVWIRRGGAVVKIAFAMSGTTSAWRNK